jgi:hypothetical protein
LTLDKNKKDFLPPTSHYHKRWQEEGRSDKKPYISTSISKKEKNDYFDNRGGAFGYCSPELDPQLDARGE